MNAQIAGVVAAKNINFYIRSAEGKTLSVERTEEQAVAKAKKLKSFKPEIEEVTSSFLVGGTTYRVDGKELELPEALRNEGYNASLRVDAKHLDGVSVGDSVVVEADMSELIQEDGTDPVLRASNFKLSVRRKAEPRKSLADYLS